MRTRNLLLLASYLFLAALTAGAAVPLRFAADAESPRTHQASAYRGETLDIEARLLWRGAPLAVADGAEAAMCWQTNGMGDAWWMAPASVTTGGVVTATWSPSNDVGAASYRVFLRVSGPGGASYRANMLLRLLGSPGDAPNVLQLPVKVLDFARISYTNEPWATASGLSTNDVRALIEADAGPTNKIMRLNEDGAYVGSLHVTDTITTDGDMESLHLTGAGESGGPELVGGRWEYRPQPEMDGDREIAVKEDIPSTDGLARTSDVKAAEISAAASARATLEMLYISSNVVAEVTNYNSSVRAPQLRLLQLDQTNGYQTVWAETNGLTRTLNEANAHTDAATNALGLAKADRAWSRHTSGLGADAPAGVTWISTPETVVAGGYEYAKQITSHGEAWVLTSNGLTSGADTNAYFRVATGDGETLFSIEKTDSVIIGVDADGITVSGGTVSIPLSVVSQDPPVCYAANSLVNATWIDLSDSANWPAWVTAAACTGTSGAWVWTIQSTAPSAFFQFRALQEGSTVIRNNAQTDLSQGIIVNGTRFYPHVSGGTLTWTTTP